MMSTHSIHSLSHGEIELLENELNKLRVSTREALGHLSNEVQTLQEHCSMQEQIISEFEEQVAVSQFNERYWKERCLEAEKRLKRQGEISINFIKAASARNLSMRNQSGCGDDGNDQNLLSSKEKKNALSASKSCRRLNLNDIPEASESNAGPLIMDNTSAIKTKTSKGERQSVKWQSEETNQGHTEPNTSTSKKDIKDKTLSSSLKKNKRPVFGPPPPSPPLVSTVEDKPESTVTTLVTSSSNQYSNYTLMDIKPVDDEKHETDSESKYSESKHSDADVVNLKESYEKQIQLLECKIFSRDSALENMGEKIDQYERLFGKKQPSSRRSSRSSRSNSSKSDRPEKEVRRKRLQSKE